MINKILFHIKDLVNNPYLIYFLLRKYIKYGLLGFKTKPIINLNTIRPTIHKSFIRWGDGETNSALGISFSFEKSSKTLTKYLNQILNCDDDNILLGLPLKFLNMEEELTPHINIWKTSRIFLCNKIKTNKVYGDAFFFRDIGSINNLFNFYGDKEIFLISNENTIHQVLLHKSHIKGFYKIPYKNSFDDYDNIKKDLYTQLDNIKNTDNMLILVSGGPFAKVLTFDITREKKIITHDVGAVFDIYL